MCGSFIYCRHRDPIILGLQIHTQMTGLKASCKPILYLDPDLSKGKNVPSALTVIKALELQALYLKGQRGKRTGIKGAKLFQAAFEVGVPDSILERIRRHMAE